MIDLSLSFILVIMIKCKKQALEEAKKDKEKLYL